MVEKISFIKVGLEFLKKIGFRNDVITEVRKGKMSSLTIFL